jgi:glutathione S-transferase
VRSVIPRRSSKRSSGAGRNHHCIPDLAQHSRALGVEDYFDEQCGPDARRVLFNDNLAQPETFVAMFNGADRPRSSLLKTLTPLICQVVKRRFQIPPETVEESRKKVRAAFDRIEADVGPSGYLVGESFSVADLAAASILGVIVVPPAFPHIKVPRTSAPPSFAGSATRSRTIPGSSGSRTYTDATAGRAPSCRQRSPRCP